LTNTANTSGTSGSSIFGGLSGILNSAINYGNSNRLTVASTVQPNNENIINNPTSQSSMATTTITRTTTPLSTLSEHNGISIQNVTNNANGSSQNTPNKTSINQNGDANDNDKITKVINSKLYDKKMGNFRIKSDTTNKFRENLAANDCDRLDSTHQHNDNNESGLITIVTISGCENNNKIENNNLVPPSVITMKNPNGSNSTTNSNSKNEMDILAHL
jgi:hypothetical protein